MVIGHQLQPLGCKLLQADPDAPTVIANLRVREKTPLPDGMQVASGDVHTSSTPQNPIEVDTLAVPASVQKKLVELEKNLIKTCEFLHDDDPELEDAFDVQQGAEGETLLESYRSLLKKAKSERLQLLEDARILEDTVANHGDHQRLCAPGAATGLSRMEWTGLCSGTLVLDDDGAVEYTDQVLARCQRRDKVSKDRCRRFIVGRLLNFTIELKQGHDVMLGSCLIIKWGSKDSFALVRILRMYSEDGQKAYSMKLNRHSRQQHYRVELLVPQDMSAEGSQRYRSSGWQLGPVSGTMVLRLVDLVPLYRVTDIQELHDQRRHDACLSVDTILSRVEAVRLHPGPCECTGSTSLGRRSIRRCSSASCRTRPPQTLLQLQDLLVRSLQRCHRLLHKLLPVVSSGLPLPENQVPPD